MSFFKLPKPLQWAAWICLLFAVWLSWDLSHWWTSRDDYSFGFLVPMFAGYVIYDRWPRIWKLLDEPDPKGGGGLSGKLLNALALCALFGGMVAFLFAALYKVATGPNVPSSFLMAVSFGGMLLAGVYFFADQTVDGKPLSAGRRLALAMIFLFPALIWILSAPLFSFVETKISTFLLNKVTIVVFNVFDFLGFPLERRGSVLILPMGEVGVEDACSGIRSLTACLFAGSFLAAVFLEKLWKKVALVASAMALAVLMNLFRSLFLTSWAYANGSDSIAGTVHDVTGYAVLGFTVVGLLCLLPIFNFRWEYEGEAKALPVIRKKEDPVPSNKE